MRKGIVSVIIVSGLVLHCAARLGLIAHLIENRNQIAFFFGVIKEIPVTTCSSTNDFSTALSFQQEDSTESPVTIVHTDEITLFYQHPVPILTAPLWIANIRQGIPGASPTLHSCPNSIFHPPSHA
ncbi:MAG: hypothetical protein JSS79_18220 [Bacteroidetes bacterium]|nr:hypothetical protein [Bacteroidota bacterium]